MKRLVFPMLVSMMCLGATCWKPVARTVLDVAELACLLEQEDVTAERELLVACNIAEELIPEVRKVLSAKKLALKRGHAATPSASASASTK